ncbi:MAG: ATP-binding cassette domain-containing protein [Beijerinckiaceae bacterium]
MASKSAGAFLNTGLSLSSVSLQLNGKPLVELLTASIAPGEILTVMGPSGSGKSTLLAFLGGTLNSAFTASGSVLLNGRDITGLPPEQRRIGVLFQDDLLFPHLSVAGNLAFGLTKHLRGPQRRARIEEALVLAGLAGFADRDPATLSGGQRARVSLLRTLLAEPEAILLDEPFSKLDRDLRQEFRAYVFEHCRRFRLPTIFVTHDAEDVLGTNGEVMHLSPHGPKL